MADNRFPVIDMEATGANITRLRKERGLSVRDLQAYFGFSEPRAIYKWQCGKSLPTVDNLYALGVLLETPLEDILVAVDREPNIAEIGQQAQACCPIPILTHFSGSSWNQWFHSPAPRSSLLPLMGTGAASFPAPTVPSFCLSQK